MKRGTVTSWTSQSLVNFVAYNVNRRYDEMRERFNRYERVAAQLGVQLAEGEEGMAVETDAHLLALKAALPSHEEWLNACASRIAVNRLLEAVVPLGRLPTGVRSLHPADAECAAQLVLSLAESMSPEEFLISEAAAEDRTLEVVRHVIHHFEFILLKKGDVFENLEVGPPTYRGTDSQFD